MADVIEKLGTDQFCRLRIGIGKSDRVDDVDYVLSRPGEQERLLLDEATQRAQEAVICWVEHGIDETMSRYN